MLRIGRKEIVELSRDGRVRGSAAIVLGLLIAALASGWADAARVKAERDAAQQTTRRQWEEQGTKNPHSAAHYGIFAFRPRPPLSFVDPGIDPYTGIAVWLEAHRQNEFRYRPARDMTAAARLGQATAAFVLQLLLPLLIILLVAPTIAGEREMGTLQMLAGMGVRPWRLIAGKAIGVLVVLGSMMVPAAIVGSALMVLAFGDPWNLAVRAATMGAGYAIYFAAFIALGLLVSAWAPTTRAAMMTLLAFWVLNAVTPRITSDLARHLYPLPSAAQLSRDVAADIRQGLDGHSPEGARADALRRRVLGQYGVSSLDALPVNFDGIALQEGEDYSSDVYDRHYDRLWGQIARQNQVHLLGSVLAPIAAVRSWSLAVAGMDWEHYRHFARAAEDYRRRMVRTMNEDLIYRSTTTAYDANTKSRSTWEAMDDFAYEPPTVGRVIVSQRYAALALFLWCLIPLALGAVMARHLRVL